MFVGLIDRYRIQHSLAASSRLLYWLAFLPFKLLSALAKTLVYIHWQVSKVKSRFVFMIVRTTKFPASMSYRVTAFLAVMVPIAISGMAKPGLAW
ncbi:hypothetical protein HD554DRAFT_1595456 [Boletus coccyginus]|nr:hypothetical protein HD554DRAFT_1595456 [Boletus coccyginus]